MKFKTPKVAVFQCHLVSAQISIQGRFYTAVPYDYDGLGRGFQVIKNGVDEQCYNVIHKTDSGINTCDCPDYLHRHQDNGWGQCKHGRALVELGFIPKPIFPGKNPSDRA